MPNAHLCKKASRQLSNPLWLANSCVELLGTAHSRKDQCRPGSGLAERRNLLGLDYLQRSKAVLDLGEMTMKVGGNVVTLQGWLRLRKGMCRFS